MKHDDGNHYEACDIFVSKFNQAQDTICSFLLKTAHEKDFQIKIDNEIGAVRMAGVTFKVSADYLDQQCKNKRIIVTILRADSGGYLKFKKVWADEQGDFNLNEVYEVFDHIRMKETEAA